MVYAENYVVDRKTLSNYRSGLCGLGIINIYTHEAQHVTVFGPASYVCLVLTQSS